MTEFEYDSKRPRILIVEDDVVLCDLLARVLSSRYDVEATTTSAQALAVVMQQPVDAAIIDYSLGDGTTGLELIATLRAHDETLATIILSGNIEVPEAVLAMQRGAVDVQLKPPDFERLLATLRECLPQVTARRRLRAQSCLVDDPYGIFDASAPMERVLRRVMRMASIDAPMVLEGEAGTGKHALIQIAHQLSPWSHEPLGVYAMGAPIDVDAAIDALERMLTRRRAERATILLRDIESAPPRVFDLVDAVLQTENRVLASSEGNLAHAATTGGLPERVWHRIAPYVIAVPSLHDRGTAAIDARIAFTIGKLRSVEGVGPFTMDVDARELLHHLPLPGNVPQLAALVREAFVYAGDVSTIALRHVRAATAAIVDRSSPAATTPDEARWSLRAAEQRQIEAVLTRTEGHITQAARLLGITRSTLYRKMREFGLVSTTTIA